MAKCSFCGYNIEQGTGKTVIQKDGSQLYFCTMKCEKNLLKLKRKPREYKWTKSYVKKGGKK